LLTYAIVSQHRTFTAFPVGVVEYPTYTVPVFRHLVFI